MLFPCLEVEVKITFDQYLNHHGVLLQSAPLNENKRDHLVPRLSLPDTGIAIQSMISDITAVDNCWLRRHAKSKAQNCASTPYKCFFADVCVTVK